MDPVQDFFKLNDTLCLSWSTRITSTSILSPTFKISVGWSIHLSMKVVIQEERPSIPPISITAPKSVILTTSQHTQFVPVQFERIHFSNTSAESSVHFLLGKNKVIFVGEHQGVEFSIPNLSPTCTSLLWFSIQKIE